MNGNARCTQINKSGSVNSLLLFNRNKNTSLYSSVSKKPRYNVTRGL